MAGEEDMTKVRRNSTVHNTNINGNTPKVKEEEETVDETTRLDKLDPGGGRGEDVSSSSSCSGGESSSLSSGDLPPPPDGGWGWVVVFASFMIHVVADGITYTFGIYLVELMSAFPSSGRGAVSLIPSILVGVTLCAGPMASSLTNRYGCRPVTILGAAVASLGLGLSALAPNLVTLYLTAGVLTGLGFGFIYLPAIVSVSMYFEKRRAFATGIAVCGSGLGTFVMAPVARGLIDWLGWRGALASTGAIVLSCIGFGALFRPLSTKTDQDGDGGDDCEEGGSDGDSDSEAEFDEEDRKGLLMGAETVSQAEEEERGSRGSQRTLSLKAPKLPVLMEVTNGNGQPIAISPPEIHINGEPLRPLAAQFEQQLKDQQQQQQQLGKNGFSKAPGSNHGKMSYLARCALSHPVLSTTAAANSASTENGLQFGSHSRIDDHKKRQQRHHHHHHHRSSHHGHHHRRSSHHHPDAGVMFRRDIFYGGSLYNIPEYKHNPKGYSRQAAREQQKQQQSAEEENEAADHDKDDKEETSNNQTAATTTPDCNGAGGGKEMISERRLSVAIKNNQKKQRSFCLSCVPKKLLSSESLRTLRQMLDLSLFRSAVFLMFAVSNFLTSVGFNVPYVYTVDRAIDELSVDKDQASLLLAVIGISNTLGRIALGYLSDKQWVNRLWLYNCCLAVCGLAIGLSSFWPSYPGQASYCAVFGVTSGAYVGLTSVVLVDLLGLDRLTNAFGLLMLFQGIASVIGPPIIGAIYDAVGNYATGFYFAGAMIFISGVMLFALPAIIRRTEEKKQDENGPKPSHERSLEKV